MLWVLVLFVFASFFSTSYPKGLCLATCVPRFSRVLLPLSYPSGYCENDTGLWTPGI